MPSMAVHRSTAALLLFAIPGFAASSAFATTGSPIALSPTAVSTLGWVVRTAQGDAKELMAQGLELLRRGDDAGALEKFRAVVAADPSSEAAWSLWREVDKNVWLRMIAKGNEFEAIAKSLLAKAQPAMQAAKKDTAAVNDLVEKALGGDFVERQKAIGALATNHGAFAIQGMVGPLSDEGNDERRIRAIEAAYRLGGSGVPALMALLDSPNALLRRSAIIALGRIKDARSAAALAAQAATETDGAAKREAMAAAEASGMGGGVAVDALLNSAMAFLRQSPDFVRPSDANNVTWLLADGKLVDEPISRSLYGAEMARRMAVKALGLAPDEPRAVATVAMAYAEAVQQQRQMAASGAGEEDTKDLSAKIDAIHESLRLCGSAGLEMALQMALSSGDSRLSCTLLEAIGQTSVKGAAVPAVVGEAMKAPMRDVRIVAALVAAGMDPNFGANGALLSLLAEGVGERVQRIAVVIDEDSSRRDSLVKGFEDSRWFAASADSAATGLARLRRFPGTDLVVVSASLKDIVVDQVISELRGDDRTKGVAIVAVGAGSDAEMEAYKTRFADKVKGVVRAFDAAAMEKALEGGRMNPERERAEQLAAACAMAIGSASDLSGDAREACLAALADAAAGRADGVRLPALGALARFGGPAQQGAAVAVLSDAGASPAAKAAAANVLAAMGMRGAGLTDGAQKALGEALNSPEAAVRAAAASALGRWANVPSGVRSQWLRERGASLSGDAPKAEASN